jgi:hypothetical protein
MLVPMRCMNKRTLSFIMLLAVSLGWAGRFVHEWAGESGVAGIGQLSTSHRDGDAPQEHPRHDHEHCAVCPLLAAPRIDRLPGTLIVVVVIEPPRRGPAPLASIPHGVVVPTLTDARAPPAAPHA